MHSKNGMCVRSIGFRGRPNTRGFMFISFFSYTCQNAYCINQIKFKTIRKNNARSI